MIKLLFLILLALSLNAKTFTVASYNVENLFDLQKDKSDYKEYKPYTNSKWNKKNFEIKVKNIIKVLKDIDADIIALQEIENKQMMQLLLKKLPQYKYYSFAKYKNASVGLGFLSKIKIKSNEKIQVKFSNKLFRPILESTFEIKNIEFKVFNNHWPSKRSSESYRIKYAKTLFDRLNKLPRDYDYILLGDFNSNYDEYKTLYKNKKLNDTNGITGINQVLNTTLNKEYVSYDDILKRAVKSHYNLWLDLEYSNRFSNKYKGRNNTPDNIILPSSLFDSKKISYIPNSFKVHKAKYLYKNNKILRWKMKKRVHLGKGFSDHLPILAEFSTKKENREAIKSIKNLKIKNISQLYKKTKLINDVILKDVLVIYKYQDSAIIKQKQDRAIFLYKNAKDLKEGFTYDLKVSKIKDYFGLKEIKDFKIEKIKEEIKEYKTLYKNANTTDIFNLKNQNEIITNLQGLYKNKKLYFKNKKIKLFFKNREHMPKNGSSIMIKRGHLSYYKNQIQIVIYDKSEIDVN